MKDLIEKANLFLRENFKKENIEVKKNSMVEKEHCFIFNWGEIDKEPHKKVGVGFLYASKDGKHFDLGSTSPFVDSLKDFELHIQGLEEYWFLEIPYNEEIKDSFQKVFQKKTDEMLSKIENGKLVLTEAKANFGGPSFAIVAERFNKKGIDCKCEIKTRKKSN